MSLFIGGISTRRMKRITKLLLGREYSAGTVSRIDQELTEEMRAWMEVPIQDDICYLFLDGLNLPVRRFRVSKESLLVAIGITNTGYRRFLGVQLGDRESASSWREFLSDLRTQRCVVHKLRNIAAKLLRSIQRDCLTQCKRIFYAASLEEALERFDEWREQWQRLAPSAVECLAKDIDSLLQFYRQPQSHRQIRTTGSRREVL